MDPNPPKPPASLADPPPPLPPPPRNPFSRGCRDKLCTCEHTCLQVHPGGNWIPTSTKRNHERKAAFMKSPYYWRGRARGGRGAGTGGGHGQQRHGRAELEHEGTSTSAGRARASADRYRLRRGRGGYERARGSVVGLRRGDVDAVPPSGAEGRNGAGPSSSSFHNPVIAGDGANERIYAPATVASAGEAAPAPAATGT